MQSIDNLNLSPRTRNALGLNGIETVEGICSRTREEMAALNRLGDKGIEEIDAALKGLGLWYSKEEDKPKPRRSDTDAEEIYERIEKCAKDYREARSKFNDEFKWPLQKICFKVIRHRLIELDGRNRADIASSVVRSDDDYGGEASESREYECRLPFHLPYSNVADTDGEVCRQRFYNYIATGVDFECSLHLNRYGNAAEGTGNVYRIKVREEDYHWLYRKLFRMGFFDEDFRQNFQMWEEN